MCTIQGILLYVTTTVSLLLLALYICNCVIIGSCFKLPNEKFHLARLRESKTKITFTKVQPIPNHYPQQMRILISLELKTDLDSFL